MFPQVISVLVSLLFLVQVMYFTSKHKLKDQQAFLWIIISFAGLIIAISIPLFNRVAAMLGISYMPALIFLLAFLIILSIVLYQTTVLSDQQEKIKNLVQELAYLKKDLRDTRNNMNNRGSDQYDNR
ncbi:DUF2304 domain-containing protein [Neobacillus sp. NPDC097160]|uniref:DUF2304 domain-containing protein n=1 Tax=Neobacillus sp. NPDC097160 TaxID=3364298 RepID=UPI0037FEA3A8